MLNLQLFLDLKSHFNTSNPLLEVVHIEGIDFSQFNLIDQRSRTYGTVRVSHTTQIFSARNQDQHNDLVKTCIQLLSKPII